MCYNMYDNTVCVYNMCMCSLLYAVVLFCSKWMCYAGHMEYVRNRAEVCVGGVGCVVCVGRRVCGCDVSGWVHMYMCVYLGCLCV